MNTDLISRDALLAAYDAAHKGPPGGARKLIVEAPAVCGWISVKDRLPEHNKPVIVALSKEIHNSTYQAIAWITSCGTWDSNDTYLGEYLDEDYEITNWMPLPEPPKEDNDAEQ